MNSVLRLPLEQMLAAYGNGRKLILLFDYDGTLVPVAEHPRLAVLPSQTRRILERLIELPRVYLGILSGRHLAELTNMVEISGIYLSGTSGLELDFAGIRVGHPAAGRSIPALERLGELLTVVVRDFQGAWLERKPMGLTVHFRHVAKNQTGDLRDRFTRAVAEVTGQLKVLESAMSLEITPNLGWDKGTAVRMIVESVGATDPLVLYAGDSANDADAIAAVVKMAGITVGVGSEAPSAAQVCIGWPRDLIDFLAELAAELETKRRLPSAADACVS